MPSTIMHQPDDIDALAARLDEVLIHISSNPDEHPTGSHLLSQLAAALLEDAASSDSDPLFTRSNSATVRRVICASLLRLISARTQAFEVDIDARIRVLNLVDEVVKSDFLNAAGVTETEQGILKISKLAGAVMDTERRLTGILAGVPSLRTVPEARQQLMRALNSAPGRTIIIPFLPDNYSLRLKELFEAVANYVEVRETPRVVPELQTLISVSQDFFEEMQAHGTLYTRSILAELASRVQQISQADFSSSPYSKPADVRLVTVEKRYPLTQEAQEFPLHVRLENLGKGHADDVRLAFQSSDELEILQSHLSIGRLDIHSVALQVPCRVLQRETEALVITEITWQNFDGTQGVTRSELLLAGQRTDLAWDRLRFEQPYSLEPVDTEQELVGRSEILNQLLVAAQSPRVTSFFISGQKRVGKTSIAKTLATELRQLHPTSYAVIYLESGSYRHHDPETTINNLVETLVRNVTLADDRLSGVPHSDLNGSLAPLARFLDSATHVAPELKGLFILDEFDELPTELFRRGVLAGTFFLNLRSISGLSQYGFVLVGGEKMDYILSTHGQHVNKFTTIAVDYFDRATHWIDFTDLIRRPVAEWFEISDDAVMHLYEESAGNPFFAKLISAELFTQMVKRRDSHVTAPEVDEAIASTIMNAGVNRFQHFWTDGIVEDEADAADISARRRRVLLSLADCVRRDSATTRDAICSITSRFGLSEGATDDQLTQFVQRRILVNDDGSYSCKVPLFQSWLIQRGAEQIVTTFDESDIAHRRWADESAATISPEQLVAVVSRWGTYRGQPITEDKVRAWLSQFDGAKAQRLMFTILEHLNFVGLRRMREAMAAAQDTVKRNLRGIRREVTAERRLRRDDIVVSYLDASGKSGSRLAKMYAEENRIYQDFVVDKAQLSSALRRDAVRALVFVDDFIGSGNSATSNLRTLEEEVGELLRESGIPMFLVAIAGFELGKRRIERAMERSNLTGGVFVGEVLDETAKCFGGSSRILTNPDDRSRAMELAWHYGSMLEKRIPLGYEDGQLALVFDDSVPNNSLPILWSASREWRPLFPRH